MDTSDRQEKISRSSLHVEVADRVRDMIFDRSLPPGTRIDELELSARLGTSRTPLREALKVLAHDGLVRLVPGRGAFVTELAPPEIDALFPVLAMLEGRCAAEAVRRGSPGDVNRLQAFLEKMEGHAAAGDSDAFHREADALHDRLHLMAGNPWLRRATADLRRFLGLVRAMSPARDGRLMHALAEHRTLMKAIARGDAASAGQVMHHHLLSQQKAWRIALLSRERSAGREAPSAGEADPAPPSTGEADSAPPSAPAADPATVEAGGARYHPVGADARLGASA